MRRNIHAAPTALMSSAEEAELKACLFDKLSCMPRETQMKFLGYTLNTLNIQQAVFNIKIFLAGLAPAKQKRFRDSIIQWFAEELSELDDEE